MKKALFIIKYFIGDNRDNLYTKFSGQIEAVEKLGYDVWYTALDKDEIYLCNKKENVKIGSVTSKKAKLKIWEQVSFYNNFYKAIFHYIDQLNVNFDFSYIRSMFFCPHSIKLLKYLSKSSVKVVMEVPTHPAKNEYKRNSNTLLKYALLMQHELTKLHSKYVDLYTVIGEPSNGNYFGSKAINIENGIQIESIPAKEASKNDSEIHILALATMAKWHGYDRLIRGMYNFYKSGGREEIFLHMVGNDGDGSLSKWKHLAADLKLNNRVIFEGYKYGTDLQIIINKCDIAVSSLAGHRIGVYNTVEMKSREYMARGIPFIYSTNDKVLNDNKEFCMKVDNNDDSINFDRIIDFVGQKRNKNNLVFEMREYAAEKMSWTAQFEKIIKNL